MGLVWFLEAYQQACVAGVRKGRGRELGRETRREGGGRRGTPGRKPLFSPSRLLIKKVTKKKRNREWPRCTYSGRISCTVFLLFS